MAKGQQRSNREARKPKQKKGPEAVAQTTVAARPGKPTPWKTAKKP